MKKITYPLILATALAFAGCTNDDNDSGNEIDESLKTKIEFTMTDATTGKTFGLSSRAGFEASTQIAARFVSTDNANTRATRTVLTAGAAETKQYSDVVYAGETYNRYWDDCFGRSAKLSIYGVAVPGKSGVTYGEGAKTIESLLDLTGTQKNNWVEDEGSNDITWTMSTVQDSETLGKEDLCYTNNIQADEDLGKKGRYVYNYNIAEPSYPAFAEDLSTLTDGCMQFKLKNNEDATGPGKFDKGHMIFKHATAQITIDVVVGDGFTFTSAKNTFKFTDSGKNVQLLGFHRTGTLNIKSGEWTNLVDADKNVDALSCTTTTDGAALVSGDGKNTKFYTLQGQFIPGRSISSTVNSAAFQLTIDGNTYYISEADIYKALVTDKPENTTGADPLIKIEGGNSFKFEQGKNYKFTIKVGKTGINALTATLLPWAEVTSSELTPSNGRIELVTKLFSGTGITTQTSTDAFSLYRALDEATEITDGYKGYNWGTGYTNGDAATLTYANSKYSTNWYWESNKSYYHFRTLSKDVAITKVADGNDYFTMTSGVTASTDYQWGAPFVNTVGKIAYDPTNGFDIMSGDNHTQLIHAIGPLKNDQVINITQQHMMSNIKVVLKTVEGAQGVALYDNTTDPSNPKGATVTLTNFYEKATVLMGTGLVSPITTSGVKATQVMTSPSTTSSTDYFTTANTQTNAYTWSVVPQLVDRGSSAADPRYVGLTITTPDNNMYYVVADLSTITASEITSPYKADPYNKGAITRWYPGYEYTYTITLKKTGIAAITASVIDWVPVEAANKDVTLEAKRHFGWR